MQITKTKLVLAIQQKLTLNRIFSNIFSGQKFALLEIKILLTRIVLAFQLEPITKVQDLIFISDIILRTKDPIYVRYSKRH